MSLFGKLFEKKYCSICGEELMIFGKTKLADGLLCSDCADKLSPFFTGAREATVEQIKEQLAYRQKNKKAVKAFGPTLTLGTKTKVYIDEDDCKVIVTDASNWRKANPDVFDYSQITGCNYDVDEDRRELTYEDKKGNTKYYTPPRYEYRYNFNITIFINHPYVSKITFRLNQNTIERKSSAEFISAENLAKQICDALTKVREGVREAKAPKTAMQCPHCLATTLPDENGCCEYCGGVLV